MKHIVLIPRLTSLLCTIVLLAGLGLNIDAQCNYTLACNDLIQLSLGDDCTEVVTPDIVLENPDFDDIWYVVTVTDENGDVIPDATVDGSHIGMTLTTQVTLIFNDCNLTCWGELYVEDKLPPIIVCPLDTIVDCGTDLDPSNLGEILIGDISDCSGGTSIRHVDQSEIMLCADEYSEIITRTWIASDIFGNQSTCEQQIFIMAAVIDSVEFPEDFIVDCEVLGIPIEDLTPEVTGKPTLIECSNIQYFYTDLEFPLCGNGLKIRREWQVLDWCTGRDTLAYQTIKVEDTMEPVIECGTTFYEINSNVDACFSTYTVPLPDLDDSSSNPLRPNVLFDCSDITFTIEYAPFPADLECTSLEEAEEILEDAGLTLEFFEVFPNSDGEYIIQELPAGCNWIRYTFDDGCDHQVSCTKDVFVVDVAPPSAICEGYTVVSVDHTGWANMLAESLDDHSWDHCDGPLFFTARRMFSECDGLPVQNPDDLDFDEYLHFCCEDVGTYVDVELKVMDERGNYNFCQSLVYVDDKIAPIVDCPPNLTFDCSEDYRDTNLTGVPGYIDNCSADITQDYREFLNDCGLGYVLIDHKIEDNANNTILCTQRIDVINEFPLNDFDIHWPDDIETNVCGEEGLDPHALNSLPEIFYNSPCADPALTWNDLKFYDVEDACFKIVRTWTVVDWCDVQQTYFNHVQKILVFNTQGPEFANCTDRSYEADDDCEAFVNILLEISDDCTPDNKLDITWIVRSKATNTVVDVGAGVLINNKYDAGEYVVTVTAIDECDNEEDCSFDISISDDEDPTPVCLTEVVWGLGSDGLTTVWASDFNFKSFDGCNGEDNLYYSFDEDGDFPSLDFSCDDLEDGEQGSVALTMYVTDSDGNVGSCQVTLILQDNNQNACEDDPSILPLVTGTIFKQSMEGLDDIEVDLYNMTNGQDTMQLTHDEGLYMFEQLPLYGEYMIKPERDVHPLDGVSTLDLVLIQKHILGHQSLDSPYKMIAADINNSSSVTAVDLVELRKLILGIYNDFPNNTSWDFVAMTYGELETSNPWDYIDNISLNALSEDMLDANFMAVKIGDVNGNAIGGFVSDIVDSRSSNKLYLEFDDAAINSFDTEVVEITADSNEALEGFQFSFALADGVELISINSSAVGFDTYNWRQVGNQVFVSWNDVSNPSEFEMSIEITTNNVITISEAIIMNNNFASEAYDQNTEIYTLEFRANNTETNNTVSLAQNSPNPFVDATTIGMYIPYGQKGVFTIQDVNGKVIFSKKEIIGQGHSQFNISADVFNADSGIYFYSLNVGAQKITKKLVLTK